MYGDMAASAHHAVGLTVGKDSGSHGFFSALCSQHIQTQGRLVDLTLRFRLLSPHSHLSAKCALWLLHPLRRRHDVSSALRVCTSQAGAPPG